MVGMGLQHRVQERPPTRGLWSDAYGAPDLVGKRLDARERLLALSQDHLGTFAR